MCRAIGFWASIVTASVSAAVVHRDEPVAAQGAATRPAAERTGSVKGRVTAGASHGSSAADPASSAPAAGLPDVVVYLESTDPARRFSAPTRPAAISQKGARFAPELLVICVGQTVDFQNDEDRPIEHNVFSQSPAMPFDLGLYRPGVPKQVRFDKPGPVRLYCSIHRYMDGMIFVSPTPFFARSASDGNFEIPDVPPGDYVLRTWQKRRRYPDKRVNVHVDADKITPATIELSRK